MLDKNSISQLSQLKQDIVSSKDLAEGTVIGSSGRYGFVKLTDGRTAFLNPEKMNHVLPGDRIKINVVKNSKDQLEAEFETLIEAPLGKFVGQYKIKGGAHFVVPTDGNITRWIFLPPQSRIKCKADDYVLAELTRHPYEDGKAAAKILSHIGRQGDAYLAHNLTIAKFGLSRFWSKDALAQANECAKATREHTAKDLTHIPFVTIDSVSTRDMDDALFVEPHESDGWNLWVAIADPASFINPGSFIAKSARYFGQTAYLPGRVLPMLPEGLATDAFSLTEKTKKPALVCRIHVKSDGTLGDFEFTHAIVESKHKLSYQSVGAFLDGDDQAISECSDAIAAQLKTLYELGCTRNTYRATNHLLFDGQPDYDWALSNNGFIETITIRQRTKAHRIVEEAMVATNQCAGEFLAQNNTGVFSTQIGFRPERIGEVRALLREELKNEELLSNIEHLEGFLKVIHLVKNSEEHAALLAPLRRLLAPVILSTEALPHMSMGVKHYAPITSPIRRYADVCNHWFIKSLLTQQKPQNLPAKLIEQLIQALDNGRQANRELEQTLVCEYLSRNIGLEGEGVIRIVTQQGFGVKLTQTGLEGFIQIPKSTAKTYDAKRMTLTVGETTFTLDSKVDVKVAGVDQEKRRVKMELTDQTLLAPPKEKEEAASQE